MIDKSFTDILLDKSGKAGKARLRYELRSDDENIPLPSSNMIGRAGNDKLKNGKPCTNRERDWVRFDIDVQEALHDFKSFIKNFCVNRELPSDSEQDNLRHKLELILYPELAVEETLGKQKKYLEGLRKCFWKWASIVIGLVAVMSGGNCISGFVGGCRGEKEYNLMYEFGNCSMKFFLTEDDFGPVSSKTAISSISQG